MWTREEILLERLLDVAPLKTISGMQYRVSVHRTAKHANRMIEFPGRDAVA
jgi:hypothetical protein